MNSAVNDFEETDLDDETLINILLVDDQAKNLLVLEAILENPEYRLVRAQSGEEALKALLRQDFAVILLDVMMPGMDGFETAEIIRQRDRSRYIPIIFVTAVGTSDAHVARGYTVGAADYLFKPIVPDILRSKVAAFAELFRKAEEVKRQEHWLRELQRRENEAKLAEAERRLEAEHLQREMEVAREIQQHLFPKDHNEYQGLEITGQSIPATAAGGDYFDYIAHADDRLDIVIGDVSGHGIGPALLMAATRAYLRTLAPLHEAPGNVLNIVNQMLAHDIVGSQFVTLLLMRISSDRKSITYANAGHNPAYLMSQCGEERHQLVATGLPLGIMEDSDYETSQIIPLNSGDLLLLYTDGVVEAMNPEMEPFGIGRVLELVFEKRNESTAAIIDSVQSAVTGYLQGEVQQDDVTAVAVRVQLDG